MLSQARRNSETGAPGLRAVEPDTRMARFSSLTVERELFGTVRLVRTWGRIGTLGGELASEYSTDLETNGCSA